MRCPALGNRNSPFPAPLTTHPYRARLTAHSPPPSPHPSHTGILPDTVRVVESSVRSLREGFGDRDEIFEDGVSSLEVVAYTPPYSPR